ncbi:hypothetical protein C5N14_08345 [Micromonospora sp. MW-13]|uniref:SMI1/KNR4 family protein n=1 Tax=Micromonospora sp. MW-13 TaxID=2094022 RepID=UPI000EE387E1|nr:SMI1/KNR4 family protein [Micromonospora sp. MW-13]RGC69268.1 hypothetical protein C5N14_08345 [Micromonospora sp. MW-13]
MLSGELVERLEKAVGRYGAGIPSPPAETVAALATVGVLPTPDYVEFVARFGGCYVGMPVYGLRNSHLLEAVSCVDLTLRYRRDGWPGTGTGLVIAIDGTGDPIVLDADGVIRRPEHDSATSTVLAPSFHALLDRYVDDWAG